VISGGQKLTTTDASCFPLFGGGSGSFPREVRVLENSERWRGEQIKKETLGLDSGRLLSLQFLSCSSASLQTGRVLNARLIHNHVSQFAATFRGVAAFDESAAYLA